MKPHVIKEALTAGQPGSTIPDFIQREIEIYEAEVNRFIRGEIKVERFKPFRLQHGVYGQRQPGVQMFRIKIPQGRLNPTQLRCIADLADAYATGVLHLSTRQNIQLHFVKLENTPKMMRLLAETGLTTREACADTVRNVTACPLSGLSRDEILDITPYGFAITQYFLRNPICQRLPRKFKIALEGCREDHAATRFHDIGITAVRHPGTGQIGFKVVVGGGLGSTPRTAHLLAAWAPPEDLITICDAVIRVFDRHGQRQNRYKARMKFLLDKLGFPKFYELWEKEFAMVKSLNGHYTLPAISETPRKGPAAPRDWNANKALGPFATWLALNVVPQKQENYNVAMVKIPIGDLPTKQARAVADLCEQFSDGYLRTTMQQNFAMRWVHQADLPALYEALASIGLAEPGAERIENVVACPGTASCGLSITSSKGLAGRLSEMFPPGDPANEDLKDFSIKVSGCQNACAQHQLASIGFHGVGKKVGPHTAPFYEIHLGGSNTSVGLMILKIPAKQAPDTVKFLVDWYRRERQPVESFQQFVIRIGKPKLREALVPFSLLPSYKEDRSFYVDWGEDQDFTTEDLGPGECAGGAYELMEGFLSEADQEAYLATVMADKGLTGHAVNNAYRAVVAASKALLVLDGVDSSIDAEILNEAEARLIAKEVLPKSFTGVSERMRDLGPKTPSLEFAHERIGYAKSYIAASHTAFERIDRQLKLKNSKTAPESAGPIPPVSKVPAEPVHIDLRGVKCPINYVKTKLVLDQMETGQVLEVLLDAGEACENVPKSVQNDGHHILELTAVSDHYRLVVEKS
jgi:sulfite reductase beta subunit-like hemoprotein/TusA-related sulfurtransferase